MKRREKAREGEERESVVSVRLSLPQRDVYAHSRAVHRRRWCCSNERTAGEERKAGVYEGIWTGLSMLISFSVVLLSTGRRNIDII